MSAECWTFTNAGSHRETDFSSDKEVRLNASRRTSREKGSPSVVGHLPGGHTGMQVRESLGWGQLSRKAGGPHIDGCVAVSLCWALYTRYV